MFVLYKSNGKLRCSNGLLSLQSGDEDDEDDDDNNHDDEDIDIHNTLNDILT